MMVLQKVELMGLLRVAQWVAKLDERMAAQMGLKLVEKLVGQRVLHLADLWVDPMVVD